MRERVAAKTDRTNVKLNRKNYWNKKNDSLENWAKFVSFAIGQIDANAKIIEK